MKGRWVRRWPAALLLGIALAGWLTSSQYTHQRNRSAAEGRSHPNGLRLHHGFDAEGRATRSFVGVAISGGGSRAANYASAVLSELDRMGVLGHVNALSGVSGGSLAASYFVAHGFDGTATVREADRLEPFWRQAQQRLSTDFLSAWGWRNVRPDWLWRTTFSNATRTDAMAEIFDEVFLAGRTLESLANDAPALLINATAINDIDTVGPQDGCTNRGLDAQAVRWESVSLDARFMLDCLGSSPASLRLSTAVAASATFPGVFNTVTLKRFPRTEGERAAHLHLIDGGPSDNLGVEGLLRLLRDERVSSCLLVVIDAFAAGDNDLRLLDEDVRAARDHAVDFNFFDSIDAMLSRRRHDTLQRLGLTPTRIEERFGGMLTIPEFPFAGQELRLTRPRATFVDAVPISSILGKPPAGGELHCAVWLVSLDNLKSLLLGKAVQDGRIVSAITRDSQGDYFASRMNWARRPEVLHRVKVSEVAQRLATSFRLSGPAGCSPGQLSDIVWEAGRLSVEDDFEARQKVCAWFAERGFAVAPTCQAPPPARPRTTPAIEFAPVDGHATAYRVSCAGG